MGMYTELHFNSELVQPLPDDVRRALLFMLGERDKPIAPPDHPLFSTSRWQFMLRCDSYYFDADTHSTLRFDENEKAHYLCIRCNLKNYSNEIEKFIDWIMPYCGNKYEGDFLGFYRYEESEDPTLIRYAGAKK